MDARHRIRTIAANVAIAALTLLAWCQMTLGWGGEGGSLSSLGFENLKYFTVLSNLLSGVVSGVCAAWLVRHPGKALPNWAHLLRYVAATSVGLTFLTVQLLFVPQWGFAPMHMGANLWFHLILPLLAIVSFCLLDADRPVPVRQVFVAIVPMLLYGSVYYANLLVNGIGEWPNTNDWYGFAAMGMEWAPVVFAVMVAGALVIALVVRGINQLVFRGAERRAGSSPLGETREHREEAS